MDNDLETNLAKCEEAAGDAASAKLAPTVALLQLSALDLVKRMAQVGRA